MECHVVSSSVTSKGVWTLGIYEFDRVRGAERTSPLFVNVDAPETGLGTGTAKSTAGGCVDIGRGNALKVVEMGEQLIGGIIRVGVVGSCGRRGCINTDACRG